jgi:hypothetical protein
MIAACAGSVARSLVCDGLCCGAGPAVVAVVFFRCSASCWTSVSVAPLLITVSILMCGGGGSGVLVVTGIGAPADALAGFSNGMGVVGLPRDAAVFGFSTGIGVIGPASDVAAAGFSNGMGMVDVTGDRVFAAGCCAC